MKNQFKNILDKINKLPTAAKVALAGGGGLALFWLLNRDKQNTSLSSESDGIAYYPYTDESSYGSGYGTVISGTPSIDTSGLVTIDQFTEWNNAVADSIASLQNQEQDYNYDLFSSVAGESNIILTNTKSPDQLLYEAQAAYGAAKTQAEKDAAAAAGQAARAAGATNAGVAAIWQSLSGGSKAKTPDQLLYEAQAAYGAATTAAERAKAAAAGQAARAAGATDTGVASVWKSLSGGSTSNTSTSGSSSKSANQMLYEAQVAYGAAKTAAERAKAAAAGQAARADGATDSGVAAIWKALSGN